MSMPATMYAVTLGSFSRFVNRLSRKADRSITASSRMMRDVWLTCNASAIDIPPFYAGRARFVSGNCRPLPDGLILDWKRDKIKSNFLCVPSIFGIVRFRRRLYVYLLIHTLLTLEELGSYTRAAQALSLTQPAVSHHVRMLEEEYGIQIFVKGSRKLKPTADGALLLKYAHRAAAISERGAAGAQGFPRADRAPHHRHHAHRQRPAGPAGAGRVSGSPSQYARRDRAQYDKKY